MSSSIGKLDGTILKNRIYSVFLDIEDQRGFCAGRTCLDNTFVLQ